MARGRVIKTKKALRRCLRGAKGRRARGKCLGAYARGRSR